MPSPKQTYAPPFEALNRVHLSDGEFARLLDEIVTPDVYTAARTVRERKNALEKPAMRASAVAA